MNAVEWESKAPALISASITLLLQTTVMKIDEKLRVEPTSALFGELKALLGPSAVA